MTRPEYALQCAVAALLDALQLPWFHVPNERRCTPAQGARLKAQGVKAGVPDIIICRAHHWTDDPTLRHGVAIELKAPGNYPTEAQHDWLRRFAEEGWTARVCKSMPEIVAVLDDAGLLVHPQTGKRLDPTYAAMGLLREAR